jgi:hypothetical protein
METKEYEIEVMATTWNLKSAVTERIWIPMQMGKTPKLWVQGTFVADAVGIIRIEDGEVGIGLTFPGNDVDGAVILMMRSSDALRLAQAIMENCPPDPSSKRRK